MLREFGHHSRMEGQTPEMNVEVILGRGNKWISQGDADHVLFQLVSYLDRFDLYVGGIFGIIFVLVTHIRRVRAENSQRRRTHHLS